MNLGMELQGKGQLDEAIACYQKASELDPKHVFAPYRLGWILWGKGDLDGAERAFRETVRLEGNFHGSALDELAQLLESRGNWDGAIAVYQEFLRLDPMDAMAHVELGYALAGKGQADEALACYQKAVELARQTPPQDPERASIPRVMWCFAVISSELLRQQKWAEAELLLRECLALREKAQPAAGDNFDPKSMLGEALLGQKKYAEAEPLLLAGYQGMKQREATIPAAAKARLLETALRLVQLYEALGKKDEALAYRREAAVELARQALPQDSPQLAGILAETSSELLRMQKWAEAEPLARECLALREKVMPDDWKTFNAKSLLGGALLGQKKYAEAEPLLLDGYQGMKKREATIPPLGKIRLPEAVEPLVQLYQALGKKDEAARWQKEREALQTPAKKPETKP